MRRVVARTFGDADEVLKLRLEIDVFGLVAGCVRVGDIGRHELLPGGEQVHIMFESGADAI